MKAEQNSPEGATAVQRLLAGLVDAVSRFPWLVLAAAAALCGLSVYAALHFL
jgi:hypothetical protein